MKIQYRKGNLLDAFDAREVNVIAHQCNCFNTMANGIAPQIARRYPEVREADDETSPGDRLKLGTFTKYQTDDSVIFNLYGQFYYGKEQKNTDYFALGEAMIKMRNWLDDHYVADVVKIGFPKIGCGLGGGDWLVVSEMIEVVFKKYQVYVYEL